MDLNSSDNEHKDLWSLKSIERLSLILGFVLLAVSIYLKPTLPVLLGIVSGVFVGWLNFKLLSRFASKFVQRSLHGAGRSGWALVLKMVLLIVVVGLLVLVVKVNALFFLLGFSVTILAIFCEAFRHLF